MTVIMSLHEIDLAMKISDRLICVKGDHIYRSGTPEEILTDDDIRELYEIDNGSFDSLFGSTELPGIMGEPQVLVLSSGGTGIPVYRKLLRDGVPFAAGILCENDIDYAVAKRLAAEVVAEKPFCEISDEAYNRAAELIDSCKDVINAGFPVGQTNRRMTDLVDRARAAGKLIDRHNI